MAVKVRSGCFREILFLQKYMGVDPDIFVHVGEVLLHHDSVEAACVHRYFECLFDKDKPQELIHFFRSNIRNLEDIYIKASSFDNSNIDYRGTYLKEFCRLDHEFLNHYLTQVFEQPSSITCTSMSKCVFLFELDNYLEIFDEIFEHLFIFWKLNHCIENRLRYIIVHHEDEKQLLEKRDLWIQHFIACHCHEDEKMEMLFQVLASFENSRKISYYLLFLEHNEYSGDFQKLPLTPLSYGGLGGLIPVYTRWKEFASSLALYLTESKWLEHKRYLEECIDWYQKMIEDEELRELLSK